MFKLSPCYCVNAKEHSFTLTASSNAEEACLLICAYPFYCCRTIPEDMSAEDKDTDKMTEDEKGSGSGDAVRFEIRKWNAVCM